MFDVRLFGHGDYARRGWAGGDSRRWGARHATRSVVLRSAEAVLATARLAFRSGMDDDFPVHGVRLRAVVAAVADGRREGAPVRSVRAQRRVEHAVEFSVLRSSKAGSGVDRNSALLRQHRAADGDRCAVGSARGVGLCAVPVLGDVRDRAEHRHCATQRSLRTPVNAC